MYRILLLSQSESAAEAFVDGIDKAVESATNTVLGVADEGY